MAFNAFDITGRSQTLVGDESRRQDALQHWIDVLMQEGQARKAREAAERSLSPNDMRA